MRVKTHRATVIIFALEIAFIAILIILSVTGSLDPSKNAVSLTEPADNLSEVSPESSYYSIIRLNQATVEELTRLDGVGEELAEKIVAYRTEHGSFKSKEELININGIGEKTYLKIAPYVLLD